MSSVINTLFFHLFEVFSFLYLTKTFNLFGYYVLGISSIWISNDFCYFLQAGAVKNGILLPKLFWPTYCEKNLFKWSRKTFEIRGGRPRIFKDFEITGAIYSNHERSEQFMVTECFLTCSCRFLTSNKLEQLKFKLGKIIRI